MSLAPRQRRDSSGDRRSKGSMAQFVREFLSFDTKGLTRREFKNILRAQPAFGRQFERNPGAYYGAIRRLVERGDIEDRAGLMFASEGTRISIFARKEPANCSHSRPGPKFPSGAAFYITSVGGPRATASRRSALRPFRPFSELPPTPESGRQLM
jgi:hypothetical protein